MTDGESPTSQNCDSEQSDFPFEAGDTVLVRVRENGTRGNIVAKFEAECIDFNTGLGPGSPKARFDLPFGAFNQVSLRPYEAEFEVVE